MSAEHLNAETPQRPTVLCAGETMALVTPSTSERLRDAQTFHLEAGGAESNVAAHLAQLGRMSRWFSRLGDDQLGHRVAEHIRSHGVDLTGVSYDAELPTGVYFKDPGHGVLYYRAGSAASAMGAADAQELDLQDVGLVHLSGITVALSESAARFTQTLMERAAAAGIPVSFDVNHRTALWDRHAAGANWHPGAAADVLKSFAARADIVLVGMDEAEGLWGTSTAEQIRDLFPQVRHLVIKDGDVGAFELSEQQEHFEPAIPTEVVEVVGAGDAFAAGYLHELLRGSGPGERLRAGHRRASLTLQTTADLPSEPAQTHPTSSEPAQTHPTAEGAAP